MSIELTQLIKETIESRYGAYTVQIKATLASKKRSKYQEID